MKVLYIASNNVATFSENSNAYQQPYNLCKHFECTVLLPEGCKMNEVFDSMTHGIYHTDMSKVSLLRHALLRKVPTLPTEVIGGHFDCIISDFTEWSIYLAYILQMTSQKPWFVILWDSLFSNRYDLNTKVQHKLERSVRLRLYNKLVAQSKRCFAFVNRGVLDHEQLRFESVRQLVNGVDMGLIDSVLAKTGGAKERGGIAVIGRIRVDKGSLEVLAAFDTVAEKYPEARLYLVGQVDGTAEEQATVRAAIADHPHADRIVVTGRVPFLKAMETVAKCEVGLHAYSPASYLYWNHVLKVGEYQALGLASVAVRYPGTSDLIEEGETGLLIDSNQAADLAAAVIRVFGDRALMTTIQTQARQSAEKRSWAKVTRQMHEDIEQQLYGKS